MCHSENRCGYYLAVSSVPLIYAHHQPLPKLSAVHRAIALLVSGACLAVLIIAGRLNPDPSGMETHLQLGLAPCGMLRSSGIPCMTCGMTTSYTHLAHGDMIASLVAQPAGAIFAFLTAMSVWIGLYIGITGRPSAKLFNRLPIQRVFLGILAIGVAGWAYKIVMVWRATRE